MTATTARRMIAADILKLRRKPSTIAWTLFLAAGAIAVYYLYAALEHASDPAHHGPAGGVAGFARGLQGLAIFVGPLAAAMIGAEAGAGDHAAGIFGDLVATGRSRLALFAARIPAALAVTFAAVGLGLAVAGAATFAFAGPQPAPGAALIAKGCAWVLLANAVVCSTAVGLASLCASRAVTLTVLIGWELVISPQLVSAAGLGSARDALVDGALLRIEPGPLPDGTPHLPMPVAAVLLVLALWPIAFIALGAWRVRTRDA